MTRLPHSPGLSPGVETESTWSTLSADTPKFLIIGDGRVARHFAHYFSLENFAFETWSRKKCLGELVEQISRCSHVLVLISDRAIDAFYQEAQSLARPLSGKTVVHFSGSHRSAWIRGAHPLMTFADDLYSLETYRQIPFVIDQGESLSKLLPGLRNPSHEMLGELKPLYHALCVISGNFTTMLWEKVFADFENKLKLPREVLMPFLKQTILNLIHSSQGISNLTGPLVRADRVTIASHLHVLEGDAFHGVYEAFCKAYETQKNSADLILEPATRAASNKGLTQ